MSKVNVRYIVNDVDAAIPFYTDMLGFKVEMYLGAGFRQLVARRFAVVAQPTRRRRRRTSHARRSISCAGRLEPNRRSKSRILKPRSTN